MQNQKNNKPPFSPLKSFYLSCRRHLPCSNLSAIRIASNHTRVPKKLAIPFQNMRKPSVNENQDGETFEGNLQRVCDLETELEELEEWLCSELTRLKSHLGTSDSNSNSNDDSRNLGDNENVEKGRHKFERLEFEEGYLYTCYGMKKFDGVCQDLSIHISCPALVPPEPGYSSITEVLNQMAEMGKENIMPWLLESMPMSDIPTNNTPKRTPISSNTTQNNVLEAILSTSVEKLRDLVIEGLQIQMGSKQVIKWQQKVARKQEKDHAIIMVVLIQARDPNKGYQPLNEMMIGLIEARNAEIGEDSEFVIKGVHVAGLVHRKKNGQVVHNCLWCVSA